MPIQKKTKKMKSKKKSVKKVAKKTTKKKIKVQKKSKKKVVKKTKAVSKKSKAVKKKKPATKKKTLKKIKSKTAVKKTTQKKVIKKDKETRKTSFLQKLEQEFENIKAKKLQVAIKGSEGFEYCIRDNCDQPATTEGYCRYHYMMLWDLIRERDQVLSQNQIKTKIKELVDKYSIAILDHMVRDFSNEQDFFLILSEMKVPTHSEFSSES